MAKLIPGKEEFYETLRYFSKRIELTGVDVRLNTKVDADSLLSPDPDDGAFDAVILATGVLPRKLTLEGSDHPKVGSGESFSDLVKNYVNPPFSLVDLSNVFIFRKNFRHAMYVHRTLFVRLALRPFVFFFLVLGRGRS